MRHMDGESRGVRSLLSSPLFHALPSSTLDDILRQATGKIGAPGAMVFQKEGDTGTYMVAVLSSRIRISATSPRSGREITINMIDAGEVFGEMALLDGKPRSADATALEDSDLMLVERRHFLPHLISSNELSALRVHRRALANACSDTSETLGNFAMLDLPGRLARKLLTLAAEYGNSASGRILLEIRLTHTDLGRFVGSSRETVNKQMRAWEDEGIVAREGGRIVVCKPGALRRIADQD